VAVLWVAAVARAYPTDEWERTGIRRLAWQFGVDHLGYRGRGLVDGAQWPGRQIELKMLDAGRDFDLTAETPKDPQLQAALEEMLTRWRFRRFNVAILDITDPERPRYAGVNDHVAQTPGSVAKVLPAAGLYFELARRFPDDIGKREALLRKHRITADDWSRSDSHEVPFISGEQQEKAYYRKIRAGDTFSLWEWIDHALSASNNSAASTMWREATLMKLLGDAYPPEQYDAALWKRWTKEEITAASFAVVNDPLVAVGMDPEVLRLRLYFTRGANRYIRSEPSRATPFSLVQWMLKVEQGRMVDEFSSLELKKMLYLTRRRVRYLYSRSLDPYGAFFKSGSLYKFSADAPRVQYQGDVINVLNALVEIDTSLPLPVELPAREAGSSAKEAGSPGAAPEPPAKKKLDAATEPAPRAGDTQEKAAARPRPHVYIVAVMSNELKRNAATDHAMLAEAIHAAITTPRHAATEATGDTETPAGKTREQISVNPAE
jgi:hypothetical protein